MRSNIFKAGILMMMLPYLSCIARHKSAGHDDGNYKYMFKSSCNCIISKENPAGITDITVATYEKDPDLHKIIGYYANVTKNKVDTLNLLTFSPAVFQCNPCVSLEKDKKYVLYFEGKQGMESAEVRISKNSSGDIKEAK